MRLSLDLLRQPKVMRAYRIEHISPEDWEEIAMAIREPGLAYSVMQKLRGIYPFIKFFYQDGDPPRFLVKDGAEIASLCQGPWGTLVLRTQRDFGKEFLRIDKAISRTMLQEPIGEHIKSLVIAGLLELMYEGRKRAGTL